MVEYLLEDRFTVEQIDPDGKKFDKVKRIEAYGEQLEMYMQLDVNSEVFKIKAGEKFHMVLTSTVNLDGTPDTGYYTPGKTTLADDFEYVMHGKLYKISETSGQTPKVEMLVSFAGLLMQLKGEPGFSDKFELDQKLFCLIRKLK